MNTCLYPYCVVLKKMIGHDLSTGIFSYIKRIFSWCSPTCIQGLRLFHPYYYVRTHSVFHKMHICIICPKYNIL